MTFIISFLALAAVGFVLRAMFPQRQNYTPSSFQAQPMQRPNYLGTALAVGAGVVAGNMVADAMASDEPSAEHAETPAVEDQPVVEDEPMVEDDSGGDFDFFEELTGGPPQTGRYARSGSDCV